MAASSRSGEAPNGGESAATETPPRWQHGEAMASLDPEKAEGMGRREECGAGEQRGGAPYCLGPQRHGAARPATRHGASAASYCGEEEELPKNPLATFSQIAKRSPASFGDLIEAPGHFYKFQENSYRLDLTFRASSKIYGPKQNVLGNICS